MKFKRLIPALAMLLVSAILLGTSTFAWFSMNTQVTATNMQVKAVADQGILINEEATAADTHWDNEATNTYATDVAPFLLHATSTENTKTWYVAHSKVSNSAAEADGTGETISNMTAEGYQTLGTSPYTTATKNVTAAAAGTTAAQDVTYVNSNGIADYQNGEGYYVKYTYYLKSSAEAITTSKEADAQNLNITVAAAPQTSTSPNLDKALRVAVVINNRAYIFAPVSGADTTYYVNNSTTAATVYTTTSATEALTIPATNADGIPAYVYIYFEGEDTNLKTDNAIAALDQINVTVTFSLVKNTAAITSDLGVSAA